MHQPRVIAALDKDLLDARLLAERLELADELDLQSRLGGDSLGILPQLRTQGLGSACKVEQANSLVASSVDCSGRSSLLALFHMQISSTATIGDDKNCTDKRS